MWMQKWKENVEHRITVVMVISLTVGIALVNIGVTVLTKHAPSIIASPDSHSSLVKLTASGSSWQNGRRSAPMTIVVAKIPTRTGMLMDIVVGEEAGD